MIKYHVDICKNCSNIKILAIVTLSKNIVKIILHWLQLYIIIQKNTILVQDGSPKLFSLFCCCSIFVCNLMIVMF